MTGVVFVEQNADIQENEEEKFTNDQEQDNEDNDENN
jgi:hypothetical protein